MYSELVRQLRNCISDTVEDCAGCPYQGGYKGTYCMNGLISEAANAIEELSKPRWIPVTERLPEEMDRSHGRLIDADKLEETMDDRYSLGEIGRRERDDDSMVYGYKVKDVIVFAQACRKAGISDDEMRQFALNCQNAYNAVIDEANRAIKIVLKDFGTNGVNMNSLNDEKSDIQERLNRWGIAPRVVIPAEEDE